MRGTPSSQTRNSRHRCLSTQHIHVIAVKTVSLQRGSGKFTGHLAGMSNLKLISVADTNYSSSLLTSINEERHSGLFCDVTVIVQERKFRAHKCVLSASSSYFRQLFSVAGQVIELNFIKADTFDVVLNYIYTSRIYRVRSDRLEDLINAGQVLGVPFIANLAVPLAQVKGLPGLSKDSDNATSGKHEITGGNMPIITESYSLSSEEFNVQGSTLDKEVESDGDEVLFVSETEPLKAHKSKLLDDNKEGPLAKKQKVTERSATLQDNQEPDINVLSSPETSNGSLSSPVPTNSNCLTTPAPLSSLPSNNQSTPVPLGKDEMLGVQKKKVIFENFPDHPGKIKLSDVSSTYVNNTGPSPATNVIPGLSEKKTISFDKASEIDSLSPGCKVYANIGENTFDIVPVMDSVERATLGNESQIQTTNNSPKGKKKPKQDQGDHYELIMDGKTFYVCIVCKRPYVCLTSLRRHYNTHSWERKYPCHYCSKVFALAEYRTKHEICHTGERRYQCLLCKETFLNYQILSNHCKQMHNQDPSGRKKKDDSSNDLYQLLPCKTLQLKPYSFVSDDSGSPGVTEDSMVQYSIPEKDQPDQSKVDWSGMFAERKDENRSPSQVRLAPLTHDVGQIQRKTTDELEFVIPETY
ncbi:hypothetical protein DNTS_000287 [Danionella cerebrum]|uniref:Transcriptional regulator Kaiso n=1 Tax=Danionella cerebrum TaxID=2873325 RepID=A0A553R6Z7_9TELE|nr:hypothetical protein DNTS_000287 [Danionella translucida]TRY97957.1 hypothetical protein DNTS_000287 [Danionella translucida]